jgi:hypothetical protein
VIPAAAALRAGAAALLEASGERGLAATVAMADVEVVGSPEAWSMGARTVTAHRVALVLDAAAYAALTRDPAKLVVVRTAFASAMRTPETELADLSPVLRLPAVQRGWHRAYRDAPLAAGEERPEPTSVLEGAATLLDAMGEGRASAMLRRARLEGAEVPSASFPPLRRYVLRLDAADYAAVERDAALADRVKRAVHAAGTRADEVVSAVDLATALHAEGAREGGAAEARLVRALEALGATVVPVARGAGEAEVTLAVVAGGEVRVVEVLIGDPGDPRVRLRKGARVRWVVVPARAITDEAGAREAAAAACEGIEIRRGDHNR